MDRNGLGPAAVERTANQSPDKLPLSTVQTRSGVWHTLPISPSDGRRQLVRVDVRVGAYPRVLHHLRMGALSEIRSTKVCVLPKLICE